MSGTQFSVVVGSQSSDNVSPDEATKTASKISKNIQPILSNLKNRIANNDELYSDYKMYRDGKLTKKQFINGLSIKNVTINSTEYAANVSFFMLTSDRRGAYIIAINSETGEIFDPEIAD